MAITSLPKGTVRSVSKALKHLGRKLPKRGWCARNLPSDFPARELCHDVKGYFWVGWR